MNVKILGTGCAKCKKLEIMARQILTELDPGTEVEKVEDLQDIMAFGVMNTPALVVDGEVKFSGRLPGQKELKTILQESL